MKGRRPRRPATSALLVASSMLSVSIALADGDSDPATTSSDPKGQAFQIIDDESQNKDIFTFDYGVPSSPALKLVSANPDKFKTSTALKPYVFSVPTDWGGATGADAFAVDLSPYWLFDTTEHNTYKHYRASNEGFGDTLRSRLRFSAALTPGTNAGGVTSKQSPSKMGIGLSTSLLSEDDPALTPDLEDSDKTYWEGCIARLKSQVGNEYDQALASEWGSTLITLAQLKASITDGQSEAKAGNLSPETGSAIYRYLDKCLNDTKCAAISPAQIRTIRDRDNSLSRISADQLNNVQDLVAKMDRTVGSANDLLLADFGKGISNCIASTNLLAQHAPSLDLGGGVDWQGTPGKIKGFSKSTEVVWAGGRYPIARFLRPGKKAINASDKPEEDELDYFLIGGTLRASWNEQSPTGDKDTPQISARTLQTFAGLERQTLGSLLSAEVGYTEVHANSAAQSNFSKSGIRWLASASLKLGDSLQGAIAQILSDFGDSQSLSNGAWLNVSYGTANGNSSSLKDRTFLVSLSFSENPGGTLGDGTGDGSRK